MVGGVDPGKRDRDTIFLGNPGRNAIRFLNGSSVLGIARRETVPACFVTDYWCYGSMRYYQVYEFMEEFHSDVDASY